MRFPRPRPTVRTMIGLVAVASLLIWGWMTCFDPVWRWKAAIRDKSDTRRFQGINDAAHGRVAGLTPDLAISEFVGLVEDKGRDPAVRWSAIDGLGMMSKEKARVAIPALIGVLRDDPPEMKISAAVAIWRILGDHPEDDPIKKKAVAGLVVTLKDPDRRVRRWSAIFLSLIGDGEVAIPALIEALEGPDDTPIERMEILEALRRSGPKARNALPVVLEMVKADPIDDGNPGGEIRRRSDAAAQIEAARFLHQFGEVGRADVLQRLANDRDPMIGSAGAKVLATIEPAGSESAP